MPRRVQQVIFIVHGAVTLAAAIVLSVFPAAIPATVGIAIDSREYLLSYFLAAAELGIGLLSLSASRLRDPTALRLVAVSFAVFHAATALLEVAYVLAEGVSGVLIANIVVRVIAALAFLVLARGQRA